MLSSDSTQGIYAPLSQVMSDSDSEEEIHNSSRHPRRQHQSHNPHLHQQQQQHQHLQHQRQSRQRSTQQLPYQARNSLQYHQKYPNGNGHQMHHSSSMSLQNSFRSVMDGGSNFNSFNSDGEERHQTDADNVAILGTPETKDEPMTTTRKCCFIGSILLCVVTVVVFLWVIPCSEQGTCPAPTDRIKTHNWLNNYTKVELKGVINVVDGLRNWEKNLIFLYRGNVFFPELERPNSKRNGIISLVGSSGAIAWFDEMSNEPITIDCTLIDIDKDGKADCLVIDEYGELGVISPISGEWHWKYRVISLQKIDVLDFPVILPDLDGDGVYDILLATIVAGTNKVFSKPRPVNPGDAPVYPRNVIQILSGRKGKPIGDSYKVDECDWVRKFQLEKDHVITFNCVRNNTEVQRSKSLAELFSLVTNRSIRSEKLTPAVKISQHRQYGQRKETEAQRNIYSLSGRELVVENRGKCPDDCNVSFILSEERNGEVNVVKNFTEPGMYGMVPAQWHFQRNKYKSKMSGFVMKFWKWENHSAAISARKKRDNQSDGSDLPTSEFNIFDHLVQKRHTYTIPGDVARVERSTANITRMKNTSNRLLLGNYKRQMITETVVLVIFIGADTRIENTSQSDIVQFCKTERTEVICQPDLNNQENSLLIADLDEDGSQELVSYYSTFKEDDLTKNWRLVTYVQLLRLESDLPGFYEEGKRN